jgi:hypothetical protein
MHELIAVLVAVLVPVACLGLILWLQRLEETLDADVAKTRADAVATRPEPRHAADTAVTTPRQERPAIPDQERPTTPGQERSTGRAVSPLGAARSAPAD